MTAVRGESCWSSRIFPDGPKSAMAPVAAPLAGKNRGAFFYMPESRRRSPGVRSNRATSIIRCIVGYLWNGSTSRPKPIPRTRIFLSPGGNTLAV